LVITGKGLNSPDGPVLQGAVREWLRTAGAKMVAEFHDGPRDKGGSGAVVVFLRRRA
jgi:DNA-nicking Smr family endonuclease